mmetsp:Transcript_10697/g.27414  ORF Transcript_10697/g.27414 Transcript_10697/m.27414 type:complete len:181 (-) Transcript_10697:271-813(-)
MSTPGRGLPKDKKSGKKGKAAKAPPRQLYYGPEEVDTRGVAPIQLLSRRTRTANHTEAVGYKGWSQAPVHRRAPIFSAPQHRNAPVLNAISLLDVNDITVTIPPTQTEAEREEGFRSHWAFRPAPQYMPLRTEAEELRPYIQRMLVSIEERLKRERIAAEEERLRQKAAGKRGKGKGKRK